MTRELTPLELLLRASWHVGPGNCFEQEPMTGPISLMDALIFDYKHKVCDHIAQLATAEAQRCYVQLQQIGLTQLSNDLTEHLGGQLLARLVSAADQPNHQPGRLELLQRLGKLHHYLHTVSPDGFDTTLAVPLIDQCLFQESLVARLDKLRAAFRLQEMSTRLAVLLDHYVHELIEGGIVFRFDQLAHLQTVLDRLELAVARKQGMAATDSIFRIFCQLNLNLGAVARWCMTYLADSLELQPDPIERELAFDTLIARQEELLLQQVRGYHANRPSLNQLLLKWLQAAQGYMSVPPNKADGATGGKPGIVKLQSKLTVSQLGCLMRLLVDAGYITNTNHSDICRTIAEVFSTGRASSISVDSMRMKYYHVDHNTAVTIGDILMELAQLSRKMKKDGVCCTLACAL